ncbi:MAG: ABC transporter permease subunit, partial [Myxococcota bacterium]
VGDRYPLVLEAENAYYVAALLHAYGGTLLTDEGDYAFEGDAAEQTVEQLASLVQNGHVPEETNGELVKRLFVSGQAAAAVSGPWLAPDLPDDFSWEVVPLPRVDAANAPMRPYVTVESAFVAAGANAAAGELARFLAAEESALIRARRGRQVVTNQRAWRQLEDDHLLITFRQAAREGITMPTHPHMRQVFEPATRALRKVLRRGEPIEAALRAGGATFRDDTRPQPPAQDPTLFFLLLGVVLFGICLRWLVQLRDPLARQAIRDSIPAYRYLAHAFVAVMLLVIVPLVVGAFTSFYAGNGRDLHFAGIANYADILSARGGDLLGHRSFYVVLLVTVLWTVLNLALHVAIGIALALLLNQQGLRFRGGYRVLLILPWAVPNYVTALAWKGLFHRQFGAINAILEELGAEPVSWFGQWSTAFAANVTTNVWLGFPFMMVVTLGALSAIPKELYEAAEVDGATPWQRFRHVTWPMVRPVLAPAIAMGSVWTFNMFNVVFLVSGGEPDGTTEILVSEAYRWAFTRGSQYGYAAAYAVLIFGVLWVATRLFGRRLTEVPT